MHPHQTTRTTSAGSLLSTVCGANPSRLSEETHLTIDGSHTTVYQLDSVLPVLCRTQINHIHFSVEDLATSSNISGTFM